MLYTRREIGKLALMAWPATSLVEGPFAALAQPRKPNSVVGGVNIGTITYSYRSMPDQSGEATLRYVLESGISQIELMNGPAETFAGAPEGGRGRGGGRRGEPPTPGQPAAQREYADRLKRWRTSVSMDRFKQMRKMYDDAGVKIYAWKALNPNMSDRIARVHLKDRQTPAHGAGNLPWGTGDTPLKEILQLMKQEKYTFPASIELEYDVPAGSDAVKEVAKCLEYCQAAL
jgi:hypothetical protein